jgi:hypothetical protein
MAPENIQLLKAHRLDPDNWLFKRFCMSLVLLHVLDLNSEQRTPRCAADVIDTSDIELRELRRTFLNYLTYMCDNTKGTDTVAAMALEAHLSNFVFWVASKQRNFHTHDFVPPKTWS